MEELLIIIGDLEATRRGLIKKIHELEARIAELEAAKTEEVT